MLLTDEEKGFVYELPEKTNIVVFANKYNLNLEDLMTLNYIQDETEILFEGSEMFINITDDQAIAKGLMDPPPPIIVKKASNRPVIIKPTGSSSRTSVAGTSTRTSGAPKLKYYIK